MPSSRAYCSAPAPANITWACPPSPCVRATAGGPGFGQSTEPALPVSSMQQASRVTWPSRSGSPPMPTLSPVPSASTIRAPASTMSMAPPPCCKARNPAALHSMPWFQVAIIFACPGTIRA